MNNDDFLKVQSEVRRLGKRVESFRLLNGVLSSETNQEYIPFTEVEYCLGFSAFTSWIFYVFGERDKGNDQPFNQPNVSARQIAIYFVSRYLSNPDAISITRRYIPSFDPHKERELCLSKSTTADWSVSLTRAILLICRKLAYAYVGYDNDIIQLPQITSGDLRNMSKAWIKEALGKEAEQRILFDY